MIKCLIQDYDGLAIIYTDYITIDTDGDKGHPFVYIATNDLAFKSYSSELIEKYNKYIYKAFNDEQIDLSKYLFVYAENIRENVYEYYQKYEDNIKEYDFKNLEFDTTETVKNYPKEVPEININDSKEEILSSLRNIKNLTEKRYNDILNK